MDGHVILLPHLVDADTGESHLLSFPPTPLMAREFTEDEVRQVLAAVGEQLGVGPPNGAEGWFWDALVTLP